MSSYLFTLIFMNIESIMQTAVKVGIPGFLYKGLQDVMELAPAVASTTLF